MARLIVISSQVASGHVGLSAIVPALQALGHDVIALPTVLLSNHPGHPHAAGTRIEAAILHRMIEALRRNDFLRDVSTLLTGYLPTPEHVAFVEDTVAQLRAAQPALRYVCDPILGDYPKGLYIDRSAASAIRDRLIPIADLIVPNAFELGWLTDRHPETAEGAEEAARLLAPETCIVTSVPVSPDEIGNLQVNRSGSTRVISVARKAGIPNGTGDLLAGLLATGMPLELAVEKTETVVQLSEGRPELALIEAISRWRS